jgi:hypothetical protein
MPDSIFGPKEVTLNLLKGIVCENCVFSKRDMCSFGDQMNDWPKEQTCEDWSKKPKWMDDYMPRYTMRLQQLKSMRVFYNDF